MAQVKLILREDVPKLGHAGDVVTVKPGYARNYLLPQGMAIHASEGRLNELEHYKREIDERVQKDRTDKEAIRDRIQSLSLRVEVQVGEEGKLYGSVNTATVAELLGEQGVQVDRRKIELKDPIKETGSHEVPIRLHRDVTAIAKVEVVSLGGPPPAAEAPEGDEDDASSPDEGETADADRA